MKAIYNLNHVFGKNGLKTLTFYKCVTIFKSLSTRDISFLWINYAHLSLQNICTVSSETAIWLGILLTLFKTK